MEHVSEVLSNLRETLAKARDNEISEAVFILPQYVTDHNDKAAYREIDRKVNALAKAWDKMIAKLEKWEVEAEKVEASVENFYGD